jgi:hypothetical protein
MILPGKGGGCATSTFAQPCAVASIISAEPCAAPLSHAKCAASMHQLARFSVAASYLWHSTLRLDPSIKFLYDHVKVAWWNHFYHT